jgi:hypothetical protein
MANQLETSEVREAMDSENGECGPNQAGGTVGAASDQLFQKSAMQVLFQLY